MYHTLGYRGSYTYGPHGGVHFIVSGHLSCFHVLAFNMGRCREHGCHVEICPPFLPRALGMGLGDHMVILLLTS